MATEAEIRAMRGRLFGQIDEDRIRMVKTARPDATTLAVFQSLTDLTSTISDALDVLGVGGCISGDILVTRVPARQVVGPAITIRYVTERRLPGYRIADKRAGRLADRDLYSLGVPGDVAVFDCGGLGDASVMGGISALWAHRTEMAGCVVDGAVRDLTSIRSEGVPVWSRHITPITGNRRLEAIEINGVVMLDRVSVVPGDLIAADDTGVCVIPAEHVASVAELVLDEEQRERELIHTMRTATSLEEVADSLRQPRRAS